MKGDAVGLHAPRTRLSALAALTAVFVLVGLGARDAGAQSGEDTALLVQAVSFGAESYAAVSLGLGEPIASVRALVPRGYAVDLTKPLGSEIGSVALDVTDANRSSSALARGTLVVDDPAAPAPGSDECAPGSHAARWHAELSVLGRPLRLSIFVDAPDPQDDAAALLSFCPLWQGAGTPPLVADYVGLLVEDVFTVPADPGVHTWRAFLEPAQLVGGAFVGVPSSTFEVRSAVAHPHVITLNAQYDQKAASVLLTGRVLAAGRPEPGVAVRFGAFAESSDDFDSFGPVITDAAGTFHIRRTMRKTTTFSASVESGERACSPPSSTPAGCRSETVSPPQQANVTVRVRGLREPKLVPRVRDQALARRASLRSSDLPPGWAGLQVGDLFFPCHGFDPNLSKLTIHGETESPVFLAPGETAAAWTSTSVYTSAAEAQSAFERLATITAARCVAREAAEEGSVVEGVTALRLPRIGDARRAFRILLTESGVSGYGDIVYVRRGRVLMRLGFVTIEGAESELETKLARAIVARAH